MFPSRRVAAIKDVVEVRASNLLHSAYNRIVTDVGDIPVSCAGGLPGLEVYGDATKRIPVAYPRGAITGDGVVTT